MYGNSRVSPDRRLVPVPGGRLLVAKWLNVSWKLWLASPNCLRLFLHCERRAASRACCTAGRSRAIRTAMIAMTTSSSIRVNPRRRYGTDEVRRTCMGCSLSESSVVVEIWFSRTRCSLAVQLRTGGPDEVNNATWNELLSTRTVNQPGSDTRYLHTHRGYHPQGEWYIFRNEREASQMPSA